MGLLDEVGKMLGGGGAQAGEGNLLGLAQQLLSQNGGIQGLLEKFQAQGLGEAVQSWVGTGQNQGINAEQIQKVLGSEQLQALAGKLGVDPQQAASQLAQFLPGLVDKLTPNGQIPQGGGDLLAQGADILKGLFKS